MGGHTYENLAERDSRQQATETEFIAIIAEESGQTPTAPDKSLLYPLKAPLRLITTAGTDYLFPIDGREPIELTPEILSTVSGRAFLEARIPYNTENCVTENCRTYSPDSSNMAIQIDTNNFQFLGGAPIPGQAVLFSPTSDAVAVWNECDLMIYIAGYPRLMQDRFAIEEINQIPLSGGNVCELIAGKGVWSLDGRYLAYSDDTGLWLWDVFSTTTEPRLIVSDQEGIPLSPRYFSPLGRYLAVTQGEERYTLDLISGESLADGLVSPDDRLLLAFDTSADSSMLELCALTPYECQPASSMYYTYTNEAGENLRLESLSEVSRVEWQNPHSFLALPCRPDEPTQCSIFLWRPTYGGVWTETPVGYGRTFAYDANNHTMAIVNDTDTVTINDTSYDFAGMLDSDITTIEWMRSLFYQDNNG